MPARLVIGVDVVVDDDVVGAGVDADVDVDVDAGAVAVAAAAAGAGAGAQSRVDYAALLHQHG